MNDRNGLTISQFDFNDQLPLKLIGFSYAKMQWPLVYILDGEAIPEAYVGETTDAISRMASHLKSRNKSKLSSAYLICSDKFNKSATLDLEASLIKYLSADGKYQLQNGNFGLSYHNYYQKEEVYSRMFSDVWDQLRSFGIARHSIELIDNSDLFKYSPYKTLSREQKHGIALIIDAIIHDDFQNVVIEGGAGTGKTIMAVYLFKLLNTPIDEFDFTDIKGEDQVFIELVGRLKKKYRNPRMALVIPMASFRSTIKKVFRNIKGLSANMVIGPSEVLKNEYDLIMVDEAHRLRRRVNLGTYFGTFDKICLQLGLDKSSASELDWILQRQQKTVFFYDEDQSIKPSDVRKEDFDRLKNNPLSKVGQLQSQFRVKGGEDYVNFVKDLLAVKLPPNDKPRFKDYELLLFNDIRELIQQINAREKEHGLSRVVAGYAWPWASKTNKSVFDIVIDGLELRWNSVSNDWLNSPEAAEEVGCIHTTQGYDINYTGIIFGKEITYDPDKREIVIRRENYHDRNGKQTITNPDELKAFILNIYQTLMLRGIRGTYVYACDDNLRAYWAEHIPTYSSAQNGIVHGIKEENDIPLIPFKNCVPLYDLSIAAGDFSPPQNLEEVTWVSVPPSLHPSEDLFACPVVGESMNKIIPDGAVCVFRKYNGGSRNGQIVLVKLSHLQDPESGSNYTVKEYRSKKIYDDTGEWRHETIILSPRSTDPNYQPIALKEDELHHLEVIGTFEQILKR